MSIVIPQALGSNPQINISLKEVKSWMYQIQDLNQSGAIKELMKTEYELLVIEPGHNFKEEPYNTASMLAYLRMTPSGKRRIILAYIDIGEAEDYRDYWKDTWVAPKKGKRGKPDFLIIEDPDGWSGNFPVAYWRKEWKKIFLDKDGMVPQLAAFGFDGVYLDWVGAYDEEKVLAVSKLEKINAPLEMIKFIEEIGKAGKGINQNFLVVPQNAPFLIDHAPARYVKSIDGLAVEDTWFRGEGDAKWNDKGAGDISTIEDLESPTANRLKQYKKYTDAGIPVFSVDYCVSKKNAAFVYREANKHGMIPLVTRISLSRLTEDPPPIHKLK